MEDNDPSGNDGDGDSTQAKFELIRDFVDSSFDSVERDGYMVSRGAGKIWLYESHGISVPDDDPSWSSHHYELTWCAAVEVVFGELERRFGWSQ